MQERKKLKISSPKLKLVNFIANNSHFNNKVLFNFIKIYTTKKQQKNPYCHAKLIQMYG